MPLLQKIPSRYDLQLDSDEMGLITRCLALMAGLKMSPKPDDPSRAAAMNKTLLKLRRSKAEDELKSVNDALGRLEESENHFENTPKSVRG